MNGTAALTATLHTAMRQNKMEGSCFPALILSLYLFLMVERGVGVPYKLRKACCSGIVSTAQAYFFHTSYCTAWPICSKIWQKMQWSSAQWDCSKGMAKVDTITWSKERCYSK